MVTLKDIESAHERIRPFIHRTPILTNSSINKLVGAELFFKCENFQKAGSFKIRGATNSATISIDLSAGDYVELYGATDTDGSARSFVGGSSYRSTFMGGYKLIIGA